MSAELLLIRHGESEGNVGISKDPDCRLTDRGHQQARAAGQRLAEFDLSKFTCFVSPYTRAAQTAAAIAGETGLKFQMNELVREWGAIATINGATYHPESTQQLVERLSDFLHEHADRHLLIVSHAAPISVLTQLAWGESPNTAGEFWAGVSNCCLRWVKRSTRRSQRG
jgi:broad specificity phosphatase PhoE